jgi:hypothetical protein
MTFSVFSITRLALAGLVSGSLLLGLAACSVSAGPGSPDSDFFPKPSNPGTKPTPPPTSRPGEPAEVQLSATLSEDLWSGFGVRQGSSMYREGHVQISCTKTSALSCYGSFVEDNYLGYLSASGVETLIPNIVKPDATGKSFQGTLNASCSKRQSDRPVCVHKNR